jgi:ribosomal protein S18 acetylase RimI-like enzyme
LNVSYGNIRAMPAFTTRRATLDDLPAITETQRQGFAGYAAFARRGWVPPLPQVEAAGIRDRMAQPDAWCVIAHDGDAVAGHVGFLAAREREAERAPIPGLAHLWALFVREPYWGSGLARRLHAMAVAEAAARGYRAMRLFTPAGQARARAFYEREGWACDGPAWLEPMLDLDLVEYRRSLPGSAGDAPPA